MVDTKIIEVIEDYIGNELQIPEIAEKHNLHFTTVSRYLNMYFKKPQTELILKSKV